MPREYPRKLRVESQLKRILNDLLCGAVKDPRLEGIRVTAVNLSGDLGVAKIFFSTFEPDENPAPAEAALVKAAGFLRTRAGEMLRIHRVPELRFHYDNSAKLGLKLTRLIEEISTKQGPDVPHE